MEKKERKILARGSQIWLHTRNHWAICFYSFVWLLFLFFVCLLCLFWDKVSYTPDWPWTCYMDGFQTSDCPAHTQPLKPTCMTFNYSLFIYWAKLLCWLLKRYSPEPREMAPWLGYLLLLPKTQARFPAPMGTPSQPSVTPVPQDPTPSFWPLEAMHTYGIHTHKITTSKKKKVSINFKRYF